ncbi:MAG: hypothetical protein JNL82_37395 [Myxococcales bacterium]|nr:hypothetical protein [Myxococcales bacterium]
MPDNTEKIPQALVVVESSALETALQEARVTIDKIKVAMVKIYYIFAKKEIQDGLEKVPEVIKSALRMGVDQVVKAIKKIVEGMTAIHDSGYVVIALLKELPNMVDATADLLDAETARSARRMASIAAFTAVFVDERFADVQKMLNLFARLLEVVDRKVDPTYRPGVELGLTDAQLGLQPALPPAGP